MTAMRGAPLIALSLAGLLLAACDDVFGTQSRNCFSIEAANAQQPQAAILLDGCTGQSWLLVRTNMGEKPEAGFTYSWMKLERYDYQNPTLVTRY